jgi:hypothetical protein
MVSAVLAMKATACRPMRRFGDDRFAAGIDDSDKDNTAAND